MNIFKSVLESDYFKDRPPVLIDIGASGEINAKWKPIAPYSVCIAFDADDREFNVTEKTNSSYRKLIIFNRVVTAEPVAATPFFLTASPFCSSLLEPDMKRLQPWIFRDLFRVEKRIQLPAITLKEALQQIKVDHIDWFKSDTQGTDLRLYKSVLPYLSSPILAAEFEPGIIDAYRDEDKLYAVMQEMSTNGYWLSTMNVNGVQRLKASDEKKIGNGYSRRIIRKTPGWAEVTYLNEPEGKNPRQLLLLFLFALLEKQYGFASEVAESAHQQFPLPIFEDCKKAAWKKINSEKTKTPLVILKRQLKKLFSTVND